jgi:DNA polymerase III epsilon subunit-like protein
LHDKGDREKDRINCEEAYANAIKILKDIKEKRLKVVNKNRRKHNFVTDDIVVVRNYARKVKHDELYIYEPHVILKVSGSLVYTQSLITGVVRNRHISHIKRINKLNNLEIPDEILAKNALFNEKLLNDIIKASELPAERSNMRLRKRKDKEIEEERLNEEDLDDLINNYPEVEFELD